MNSVNPRTEAIRVNRLGTGVNWNEFAKQQEFRRSVLADVRSPRHLGRVLLHVIFDRTDPGSAIPAFAIALCHRSARSVALIQPRAKQNILLGRQGSSVMQCRFLLGLVTLWIPLAGLAQDAIGYWYLNPYLGGITPDKPWHATGAAVVYGVDIGTQVTPAWSAELDLEGATLRDRDDGKRSSLYESALDLLRTFNYGAHFAPYLSLGAGVTHFEPSPSAGLERRTEFMLQPGAGALIRLWGRSGGVRTLALRPAIEARWTHGWAHAPGNPVDPVYTLGLSLTL
jgi:hypothetical protein